MIKMGIFSLVKKTPMVYKICVPDVPCVQQRRELNPASGLTRI